MSDDFVLRIYVRGRDRPIESVWEHEWAISFVLEMGAADVRKLFERDSIPRAALEADRDLLRVAAAGAMTARIRLEHDDWTVSWLGRTAHGVRCSAIEYVELVDVDALPAPQQGPYRGSKAGFSPARLASETT